MKYIRKFLKFILLSISFIILILIIDYIRLNIFYLINKNNYIETIDIQGTKEKYVPQGLTYSDKYDIVLQTSYNSKHNVSMLYAADLKSGKLLKKLKLKEIDDSDNINHVGGIATDNNKVWITNNYEINEYSLEEIINTQEDYIKSLKNTKLPNRGDFCTYNNNILWIGDFFLKPFYPIKDNNPLLMGYKLNNSIDYSKPDYIISLPKMVQGMVITSDNKFIFSRSFTNLINSDLLIYDNVLDEPFNTYKLNNRNIPYYKFDKSNLIKKINLPPMSEEFFEKDNELYILFENSSDAYFYAYPKIKKVIKYKIDKN